MKVEPVETLEQKLLRGSEYAEEAGSSVVSDTPSGRAKGLRLKEKFDIHSLIDGTIPNLAVE